MEMPMALKMMMSLGIPKQEVQFPCRAGQQFPFLVTRSFLSPGCAREQGKPHWDSLVCLLCVFGVKDDGQIRLP